mgnify:CR=1 FL=1
MVLRKREEDRPRERRKEKREMGKEGKEMK